MCSDMLVRLQGWRYIPRCGLSLTLVLAKRKLQLCLVYDVTRPHAADYLVQCVFEHAGRI